jgi:FlaA1/EpsC-like NDP-sugar epimerase
LGLPESDVAVGTRAQRRVVSLIRGRYQYAMDVATLAATFLFWTLLRLDFTFDRRAWLSLFVLCVFAGIVQLLFGWRLGLYGGRYAAGSFYEVRTLLAVELLTTVVVGVPLAFLGDRFGLPRGTALLAFPLAFLIMGAIRYMQRVYLENRARPGLEAQRTLVYGAGNIAQHLVRQMLTDPLSPYVPVGLIDDDRVKHAFRVHNVPVLGTRASLPEVVTKTSATVLVISIARIDAALLREISDAGEAAGLRVMVMPILQDLLEGKSRLQDVRDVAIEDLIGRNPIDTQVETVAGYLTGKRVLVTGAGGSIGSELCKQIAQYKPAELMLLDRDETGLQTTELLVAGDGLLQTRETILADIRDEDALESIFADRRPEVVFHAAALKHLPLLERHPDEGWKTNVLGTLNVLKAAMSVDVDVFVNISTDKAANPTSVLGFSKRVAEQLTAWAAEASGKQYLSVRFGNVLGSRGSLLPVVDSMIRAGGPVTVTHANATRFFMTIPEASHLVIQAGGIGSPGEVLILDMGEPVRILDIVQRMIARSGKDIGITFTGLRPGEKLHEELIGTDELDARPIHPKISHASVPAVSPDSLDKLNWDLQIHGGQSTPV